MIDIKKYQKKKKATTTEELCKDFPQEFFDYVDYTRNLGYEDNPDYDYLREKFLNVLKDLNEEMDYIYDWTTSSDLKKRKNKKNKEEAYEIQGENEEKKNEEKDLESNNNDQIDMINNKQIKRHETEEINSERNKNYEDKVESVCCTM